MSVDRNKYKPVGGEATDRNWPPKGETLSVGDSIEGKYASKNENIGVNKSNVYVIETKEGEKVGVWGNTVLDARFENIEIGAQVAIEYLGTKPSKKTGKPYHDFFVGVESNEPPF